MSNLYIVPTPIGNLKDITLRALETLFSVDYIACEDTRRTGQLLDIYKKDNTLMIYINKASNHMPKLLSYYDEIEYKRMPEIISYLKSGKNVALVSDSGTPLISDPGFKLVKECIRQKINVVSLPGPSAIISALVSSGLSPQQFLFLGYLPTKEAKRLKLLGEIKNMYVVSYDRELQPTFIKPILIFFEAPHRLKESLENMLEILGNIDIVIAKELTKVHEEIFYGKISLAQEHFKTVKGEIVVLIPTP
ncbi:MAG: 16S rRNA (cytidine(1402)-2'-O)-methyltransferase [Patescibacteria group bacterium]|nr:16S rRNA (cytidine(1402)-2'-O)-methyltransferase [Patescibacteria group bacterium]